MKYKWLNQKNNQKLIVFFNGWGMDENIISHLECEDYDILTFYDYNTLETDFDFNLLNNYDNKFLIAWSMGVMIGSIFSSKLDKLNQSIAINGTLKPIDAEYGIHPKIYDLTIKGFDEKGRKKFISSMFDIEPNLICNRTLKDQQSELIALKNNAANEDFKYTKVLISDNDKIIPTKSQIKFWKTEANIKSGHCPFFKYSKWSELIYE